MKVEFANKKQFTVKEEEIFQNVPVGSLFILVDDDTDTPAVWMKTPFIDMCARNNPVNANGSFCTAWCVNDGTKNLYMQCNPTALCLVLDAEDLFGKADCIE